MAPKYLAALITVPCLTVLSTFCGIFAGYLFLTFSMDMSVWIYFQAVAESILVRDIIMSVVKSVVFGTIIVQVGCLEGLRVRGGPDAVGRAATTCRRQINVSRDRCGSDRHRLLLHNGLECRGMTSSSEQEPIISMRSVTASYGARRILNGVDLDIYRGEILVLLGGSGSGKTTLLQQVLGLSKPDTGTITIGGVDITRCSAAELKAVRRRIGVAFQAAALFNSLSVEDNVALPLRELTHLAEPTIKLMVWMRLKAVGLADAAAVSAGVIRRYEKEGGGRARARSGDPDL